MTKQKCLAALACGALGLAVPAFADSLARADQKDVSRLLEAATGRNFAYAALLIGETQDRVYFEYTTGVHASSSFTNRPKRVVYWLPRSEISDEQLATFRGYKDQQAARK